VETQNILELETVCFPLSPLRSGEGESGGTGQREGYRKEIEAGEVLPRSFLLKGDLKETEAEVKPQYDFIKLANITLISKLNAEIDRCVRRASLSAQY
jgi:hypothetical protein